MARPKEFDREIAVKRAMAVFWRQGYAATSTDDLLAAMKIGRQSMYDTFGDKRRLYLEALSHYQKDSITQNIERLMSEPSPMAGIKAMLVGLTPQDKAMREKGCMGINSISEFGISDTELGRMRAEHAPRQHQLLLQRLRDAKTQGEIKPSTGIEQTARFIEMTMAGLQIGAKAGVPVEELHAMANFAVNLLKAD